MILIESVPNFSTTNTATINSIIKAFKLQKCMVLEVDSDLEYNRTVITVIATPEALKAGLRDVLLIANELIDLRLHHGKHPFMGSIDVIPLIKFHGIEDDALINYSVELAQYLYQTTNTCLFYYNKNNNQTLANLRRNGYLNLQARINNQELVPDFGNFSIKNGATAIGCREFLIAYNILLDTSDKEVADYIARNIRESNGGLKNVQAIIIKLENKYELSLNLTNYHITNLDQLYKTLSVLCNNCNIKYLDATLVGLIPMQALTALDVANDIEVLCQNISKKYLIKNLTKEKVLEYLLEVNHVYR